MTAVTVNGEPREVAPGTTLAELLDALNASDTVATAVDGEFIARDARASRVLEPGARVTCFQAIVGG